jgi:hypothetical protein
VPPGDGHEGDGGGVVAHLLDKARHLFGDFLKPDNLTRVITRPHR